MWGRRSVHSKTKYLEYTPTKRKGKGKQTTSLSVIGYKKFSNREKDFFSDDHDNEEKRENNPSHNFGLFNNQGQLAHKINVEIDEEGDDEDEINEDS